MLGYSPLSFISRKEILRNAFNRRVSAGIARYRSRFQTNYAISMVEIRSLAKFSRVGGGSLMSFYFISSTNRPPFILKKVSVSKSVMVACRIMWWVQVRSCWYFRKRRDLQKNRQSDMKKIYGVNDLICISKIQLFYAEKYK